MASDTIFALSSGRPPAAISVIRISGPDAIAAGMKPIAATSAVLNGARNAFSDAVRAVIVLSFPAAIGAAVARLVV